MVNLKGALIGMSAKPTDKRVRATGYGSSMRAGDALWPNEPTLRKCHGGRGGQAGATVDSPAACYFSCSLQGRVVLHTQAVWWRSRRFALAQHIDRDTVRLVGRRDPAIHGDEQEN